MAKNLRLLVLIPAWNEEGSIGEVTREVAKRVPEADILVVDDGSTDDTAAIARAEGVRVLRLPFNLGVGGAMRAGYHYAHSHGYDVAVQVDADGQHPPCEISKLVAALDGVDLVIGSRFIEGGDYRVDGPRRWAMRLLAWRLSRIARTRLTDTTSGFRAANRRVIAMFARDYPAEYLGDTVESLVMVVRAGYVVCEVPVAMRPRAAGTPSHPPWKAAVYLLRAGLILILAAIRKRPRLVEPDESERESQT